MLTSPRVKHSVELTEGVARSEPVLGSPVIVDLAVICRRYDPALSSSNLVVEPRNHGTLKSTKDEHGHHQKKS